MRKFVTAVNCIDGRVQQPVFDFMRKQFSALYVDMITMPGVDGILSAQTDQEALDIIKRNIGISIKAHNSSVIAIFAHDDCAGHPVSKKQHLQDLHRTVSLVKSWFDEVEVFGFWINGNWEVEDTTVEVLQLKK